MKKWLEEILSRDLYVNHWKKRKNIGARDQVRIGCLKGITILVISIGLLMEE